MKSLIILLAIFLSASHAFAQEPVWSKKYHTGSVTCLQFSKDGKKLLTGSADGKVMLWDAAQGDTIRTFKKLNGVVSNISCNSTDKWFVVSVITSGNYFYHYILDENADSIRKTIIVSYELWYDVNFVAGITTLQNSYAYITNQDSKIQILTGGRGSQFFEGASGNVESGKISVYDLDSSRLIESKSPNQFFNQYDILKISPDRKYKASIFHSLFTRGYSHSKSNYLKESYTFGSNISEIESQNGYNLQYSSGRDEYFDLFSNESIVNLGFTGDSKYLLSYNRGGKVYIRSVSGSKIIDSLGVLVEGVRELSGDMRGKYYITANSDSTLRIWTRGIHNIFKSVKLSSNITQSSVATIAVSPDSVHFATAHTDGTVALWNIDSLALKAVVDSVFTPMIDSVSPNQIVCKDADAEFTVSAKSNFGEGLSYQWQKGGVDIMESDSVSGVTSATLLLKNIDKSDAGSYSVVVRSVKGGNSSSAPVQLFVRDIPVISGQPIANVELQKGGNYVLKVMISDTTGAKFQWFKNGKAIDSATKQQYTFQADSASAGTYTVRITNECGSMTSNESVVSISTTDITEENPFKNTTLTSEPNPFKNSTTIRFSLPNSLKIKLAVTDILGREVVILKDEVVETCEQNVVFKNEDLPDGTYFITLSGDGLLKTIPVNIAR